MKFNAQGEKHFLKKRAFTEIFFYLILFLEKNNKNIFSNPSFISVMFPVVE